MRLLVQPRVFDRDGRLVGEGHQQIQVGLIETALAVLVDQHQRPRDPVFDRERGQGGAFDAGLCQPLQRIGAMRSS